LWVYSRRGMEMYDVKIAEKRLKVEESKEVKHRKYKDTKHLFM
jgi:hypothetical protein